MRHLLLACVLVAGCGAKTAPDVPEGPRDAGMDAFVPPRDAFVPPVDAGPPDAPARVDSGADCDAGPVVLDAGGPELVVDLLFVVDNSLSMQEEQRALASQFPEMVRILATGDFDGDGRAEFEPVSDMQIGVVTTELWAGPFELGGCEIDPVAGDDGVLRTAGNADDARCAATYPRFLGFRPGEGDADALARDFACLAVVGVYGCGIEQPLEAALKALSPADGPFEFLHGEGHGDGANAGFAREGSILAIVLVTDENDCSFQEPDLFDPESERFPDPVPDGRALRCFAHPEALYPTSRYVEGFRALRPEPDSVLFAAVTGVPEDLVSDPERIDYDALLADPRMQERIDPDMRDRLEPACDVVGVGFAVPGRRIVEVARELRAISVVQSICEGDFSGALTGITRQLARVIRRRRCR